jgi:hypothetical protein
MSALRDECFEGSELWVTSIKSSIYWAQCYAPTVLLFIIPFYTFKQLSKMWCWVNHSFYWINENYNYGLELKINPLAQNFKTYVSL